MVIRVGRPGRVSVGQVDRDVSACVSVTSGREIETRHSVDRPYRYSCPSGSRVGTSDES